MAELELAGDQPLVLVIQSPTGVRTTAPADRATSHASNGHGERHWSDLRSNWPLAWRDIGVLAVAYLMISAVFVAIGRLLTGPLDGSVGEPIGASQNGSRAVERRVRTT